MSDLDYRYYYISTEDYHCSGVPDKIGAIKKLASDNAGIIIGKIIPPLYRESDRSRLSQALVAKADKWEIGPRGLGFVGATGLGKTRSMYALVRRLTENHSIEHHKETERNGFRTMASSIIRIPRIETVNDATLAKLVMESIRFDGGDGAKEQLKRLYAADLLFIDDLGQSKISDRIGAEIYELVETRAAELKPILFTSNFRGAQLAEKFSDTTRGDAVVRRLAEFCEIVVVGSKALE